MKLKKEYGDALAFLEDCQHIFKMKGMLLEHSEEVQVRKPAEVELYIGAKCVARLNVETVYVSAKDGKFQVGVELQEDWEKVLSEAQAQIESGKSGKAKQWGKDSESLYHAIAQMNTHEKIQLALRGGRQERKLLLKDTHHAVHPYVLKNPRITPEEVTQVIRMTTITGDMMHTISSNTEWMQNRGIRFAMIKSPKAPLNIIQKYITRLNDQELLQIAKSEHVRENVSKLAKRALASRGKPIR